MMKRQVIGWVGWHALLAMTLAVAAHGQTHTWMGGTGLWDDPAQWTNGVPAPGSEAVLASGVAIITNASAVMNDFSMTGGQLVFSNSTDAAVRADDIRITGGTVRHAANSATATNALGKWEIDGRVFFVCTNFFLEAPGQIDVTERGWAAPLSGNVGGYGPGAATGQRAGGAYGGYGGNMSRFGGMPYGSPETPDQPGSGGGAYALVKGGAAGGLVRIESHSGTVTVNGAIRANGGKGGSNAGGGSGGGVWISCRVFAATNGTVEANGGDNTSTSGGGGGGRIAIHFDATAQSGMPVADVVFSVQPGARTGTYPGDLGTLYFSDAMILENVIRHSGQILAPGFTNWMVDSLLVTNGWVRFPADAMRLTVAGDVRVTGATAGLELGGNENMGQTMFREGIYMSIVTFSRMETGPELLAGGNVLVTNGGLIRVYSAPTNGPTAWGGRIAVTGEMVVASNSDLFVVSDPTNGGSVKIEADALTILAGGTINADGAGFVGGSLAAGGAVSFGPGGGGARGGGAYGETGGNYANLGGRPNGDAALPLLAGSGGGRDGTSPAGAGGGLIWVEARDRVAVDGLLTANGSVNAGNAGVGSGGGVYVKGRTIGGQGGIIRANGASITGTGGSGSGGRIALDYDIEEQAAAPSADLRVLARAGTTSYPAELGTVHLPDTQLLRAEMNMEGQLLPFTEWSVDYLVVSNRRVRFAADGFRLTVTNAVRIDNGGYLELGGRHLFDEGSFWIANGQPVGFIWLSRAGTNEFLCGGDLILTNGGGLRVFAGETNSPAGYGALVEIGGRTEIGPGSWISPVSHPTNGGSVLIRAGDMAVASGGGIRADHYGFAGAGGTRVPGYGYGAGGSSGTVGGGGGYGGIGGNATYGGGEYGNSNAPVDPGSGGGRGNSTVYTRTGGSGGGSIRVESSGTVVLDGTLTARGRDAAANNGPGGGSGGGIYLKANRLTGGGAILARGGNGVTNGGGASGGGGRIAVETRIRTGYTGTAESLPGTGGTYNGEPGTVVWVDLTAPGTVIMVR